MGSPHNDNTLVLPYFIFILVIRILVRGFLYLIKTLAFYICFMDSHLSMFINILDIFQPFIASAIGNPYDSTIVHQYY